jgi:hypothetical protein
MIARVWHGETKPEHADAYESHLKPDPARSAWIATGRPRGIRRPLDM